MVLILGTHKKVPLILGNAQIAVVHGLYSRKRVLVMKFRIQKYVIGVSQNEGYHFRGPYNKDYSMLVFFGVPPILGNYLIDLASQSRCTFINLDAQESSLPERGIGNRLLTE